MKGAVVDITMNIKNIITIMKKDAAVGITMNTKNIITTMKKGAVVDIIMNMVVVVVVDIIMPIQRKIKLSYYLEC